MNSKLAVILTIVGTILLVIQLWPIGLPVFVYGIYCLYKQAKKAESYDPQQSKP